MVIAESGFNKPEQLQILERHGFSGVLIGTSILKSDDINKKLKEIVLYYE